MKDLVFSDLFGIAFFSGWLSGFSYSLLIGIWMLSGFSSFGGMFSAMLSIQGILLFILLFVFSSVYYQAIWLPYFILVKLSERLVILKWPILLCFLTSIYGFIAPYFLSTVLLSNSAAVISSIGVTSVITAIFSTWLVNFVKKYRLEIDPISESGGKKLFLPGWAPGSKKRQLTKNKE